MSFLDILTIIGQVALGIYVTACTVVVTVLGFVTLIADVLDNRRLRREEHETE